eukprot:scaffold6356_cov229-Prasinococcus_capsulatus_cf.AAC.1
MYTANLPSHDLVGLPPLQAVSEVVAEEQVHFLSNQRFGDCSAVSGVLRLSSICLLHVYLSPVGTTVTRSIAAAEPGAIPGDDLRAYTKPPWHSCCMGGTPCEGRPSA